MAVKIRLSRIGKTHRPYWKIVAISSNKKRDGEHLEKLGSYDPIGHKVSSLNLSGIDAWVAKGAILSDAVIKILKKAPKAS